MLLRGEGRVFRIDSSSGANVVKSHHSYGVVITDGRQIYVENADTNEFFSVPASRYAISWDRQPAIEEHTELSLSGLVSPVPEKIELCEDGVDCDAGGPDETARRGQLYGDLAAEVDLFVRKLREFVDVCPRVSAVFGANARAWLTEFDIRNLDMSEQARVDLARKIDKQVAERLLPEMEQAGWRGLEGVRRILEVIREQLEEIDDYRAGI